MLLFIEEIIADIEWRISELSNIKTIPIRYNFRADHKEIHIKYSIPAIYAIWEGFVKNCFTIYSNHLNTLSIRKDQISIPLLTHQIDSECDFNTPRINFEAKQRVVQLIETLFTEIITIKPSIPTESNVNFKVLNKILERFCIAKVDDKYERGLNKLLRFRNTIAHGENSILVDMTHISEFISLVENLMLDITINIETGEKLESYKREGTRA